MGTIILAIICFILLGLFGWVVKAICWVFELLLDGCFESCGCFIVIFLVLIALLAA